MGALHSNCVILQTGQTYQSKCVTKRRSICWGLLPRVYGSHQWITYTKLNPHMCPLSDQKDFGIHHHIREKRCGTLLNWTRGHTVGVLPTCSAVQNYPIIANCLDTPNAMPEGGFVSGGTNAGSLAIGNLLEWLFTSSLEAVYLVSALNESNFAFGVGAKKMNAWGQLAKAQSRLPYSTFTYMALVNAW